MDTCNQRIKYSTLQKKKTKKKRKKKKKKKKKRERISKYYKTNYKDISEAEKNCRRNILVSACLYFYVAIFYSIFVSLVPCHQVHIVDVTQLTFGVVISIAQSDGEVFVYLDTNIFIIFFKYVIFFFFFFFFFFFC